MGGSVGVAVEVGEKFAYGAVAGGRLVMLTPNMCCVVLSRDAQVDVG